jgi:hypothetical protein
MKNIIFYYVIKYYMDNFIVKIIYYFTHPLTIPSIITFYEFNIDELDIFESWYNTFDEYYSDNLFISRDTITYKLVESKDDMEKAKVFLDNFDRPFNLLEEIEELSILFIEDIDSIASENSVYDKTESINNIINYHLNGNVDKVKECLTNINTDDDIINDIINNYKI